MKKRRIISFVLVVLIIACAFPATASAYSSPAPSIDQPWYGICIGDGVNIRRSASTSSDILGSLGLNKPIEVIGETGSADNRWYKVKYTTSDSDVGYVFAQYINPTNSTYGNVTATSGCPIKENCSKTSSTKTTIQFGIAMPYNEIREVNKLEWAHCVCGRTAGYVDTDYSRSFRYRRVT